jgi:hypothetical protein
MACMRRTATPLAPAKVTSNTRKPAAMRVDRPTCIPGRYRWRAGAAPETSSSAACGPAWIAALGHFSGLCDVCLDPD